MSYGLEINDLKKKIKWHFCQLFLFLRLRPESATTTIRRGMHYSVTVHIKLPILSLSPETVFTCTMEIPGTSFSLVEKTMFFPNHHVVPRASMVSGAGLGGSFGLGLVLLFSSNCL